MKIWMMNDRKLLLQELQIQCDQCSGLCCFALYFFKGESFANEKQAGVPCSHLLQNFRCDAYHCLRQSKMKGCHIYNCFGAGQYITQVLYKQKTWQSDPSLAKEICDIFPRILQLHQILYYVLIATSLKQAQPYMKQLDQCIQHILQTRALPIPQLLIQNIDDSQAAANQLLKKISTAITMSFPKAKHITTAIAKDFKKSDLSGYDFTMSVLIAANLQECILKSANFLGADLRDANIENTDVSEALFLTQIQVNGAKGNQNTILPTYLKHPSTWE